MSEPLGVLFIHGMRTSNAIWESQLAAVRALGYQALAIDLPAHGEFSAERFSFAGSFETIKRALADLGRPTVIVGLSLGGYVALAYTAKYPNTNIIGVVAAGCATETKWKPLRWYAHIAAVAHAVICFAAKQIRRILKKSSLKQLPPWQIVTDALGELSGHSEIADIRAIDVPIWFINGARDPLRIQAKKFAEIAKDGVAITIPHAGHDVNTDAPTAFNEILSNALCRIAVSSIAPPPRGP